MTREEAIYRLKNTAWLGTDADREATEEALDMAIEALKADTKQTDCTEFIEWLIEVVLDDEDWELNAVAYGEIIARKMAKLGLLEVLDGYYIRTTAKPMNVVAEINIDTDEIIKRINALPSARPKGEWIPCSERLPENGHYYLWCSDSYEVQSDYYWDGFEDAQKYGYNIIAWMPLPEPYKDGDDE